MMEYILIGTLVGLLILWIISIRSQLDETTKELNRIVIILGNKEQWELSKFHVNKVNRLIDREYEFLTSSDLDRLEKRIEKLEEEQKK